MHARRSGATRSLAALHLLLLPAACGARSSLPVCQSGSTRVCEDACGVGSQTCTDEQWAPCSVPPATRTCANDCGQGSQSCTSGVWSNCDVPQAIRACSSRCGQGHQTCVGGAWQACDAPQPGPPTFTATIRDFNDTDPDFEADAGDRLDPGVVQMALGPDDKPVYASSTTTPSTHGAAYFDEWYRDVPCPVGTTCVNMTTTIPIPLAPSPQDPTIYAYDNDAFFPIDNRLFGNEGRLHNYDFTLELATQFVYSGGETFRFVSDDDSWVFLNHMLAVDLGGVHQALGGSVDLDAESEKLGIVKGGTYPMNLFYAERHVFGAVLHIDVSAADFAVCAMP